MKQLRLPPMIPAICNKDAHIILNASRFLKELNDKCVLRTIYWIILIFRRIHSTKASPPFAIPSPVALSRTPETIDRDNFHNK